MSIERDSSTPESAPEPRSRRAVLAGAIGGLAGLVAGRLGSPAATKAAAGDPIIMGAANNATGSNTTLSTTSAGTAFQVNQNGSGTALRGQTSAGIGVFGTSASGKGMAGTVTNPDSFGVYGEHAGGSGGAGAAIYAKGIQNTGLLATTTSGSRNAITATGGNGQAAVLGTATQKGVEGVGYRGVYGHTTASFAAAGVWGDGGTGTDNYGVLGEVNNATGRGVYGINHANSATSFGLFGETDATTTGAAGVRGEDAGGGNISNGVWGLTNSTSGNGVYGLAVQSSTLNYGVYGFGTGNSYGVVGESGTGVAVQAFGDAAVSGDLAVGGTLSKGAGTFKIDHPLDPANKYLLHSFVESPDMKNVYDGMVTLDGKGEATVDLPAYFDALNRDFRYQLTAIGQAAPDLHVKAKARSNKFSIAGGAAGQEVSWLVTGIRQDAYAKAHPVVVEVAKEGIDKGRYLHPTENGAAKSKGINKAPNRGKS